MNPRRLGAADPQTLRVSAAATHLLLPGAEKGAKGEGESGGGKTAQGFTRAGDGWTHQFYAGKLEKGLGCGNDHGGIWASNLSAPPAEVGSTGNLAPMEQLHEPCDAYTHARSFVR